MKTMLTAVSTAAIAAVTAFGCSHSTENARDTYPSTDATTLPNATSNTVSPDRPTPNGTTMDGTGNSLFGSGTTGGAPMTPGSGSSTTNSPGAGTGSGSAPDMVSPGAAHTDTDTDTTAPKSGTKSGTRNRGTRSGSGANGTSGSSGSSTGSGSSGGDHGPR